MINDTQTGPITLSDVRTALADTDPSRTNAGALRKVLGRGSYATIQKHLDTIRTERAPALPAAPGAIPAPPAEAVHAIWGAAWAQAQVMTLERMERLSAERDTALALVAAQAQDVAGLTAEIDAITAVAEAQAVMQAQALEEAQAAEKTATAQATMKELLLSKAREEVESLKLAAAQAKELAQRDAAIERQTLQNALERQIDKYTDLKGVVDHLKPLAG